MDRFLGLSLPGADELIGLARVARLARHTAQRDRRSTKSWWTPLPPAHTLRLLAMPEALRRFAGVLDRLQERHRWMAERFGGAWRPDAGDALIAGLEAQGREIEELLRDPERCRLVWVMLPEALSLAETRDSLASLDAAGIPVREVMVNRVAAPRRRRCPPAPRAPPGRGGGDRGRSGRPSRVASCGSFPKRRGSRGDRWRCGGWEGGWRTPIEG